MSGAILDAPDKRASDIGVGKVDAPNYVSKATRFYFRLGEHPSQYHYFAGLADELRVSRAWMARPTAGEASSGDSRLPDTPAVSTTGEVAYGSNSRGSRPANAVDAYFRRYETEEWRVELDALLEEMAAGLPRTVENDR